MATIYINATTGSNSNIGSAAEPLQTIQAGVNLAAGRDTLEVAAGTYAENLTINKRLTLMEARLQQLFTHLDVAPLAEAPADASGVSAEVMGLIENGDHIGAVRRHSQETGVGLAESKTTIDALFDQRKQ